ncbi:hypothetical protein GUJ93_ZPchr0001g31822 [Zizania palustris]|uniref:Uncharacterized protein n=1 Tax=Zizania palustris TaxID=103762 RepID=A0A8J5S0M8_ZIZPA|nr:hypothetical protein GUJ93_ZPchr0001g31822 [Zizania palustris]
MSCSGRKAGVCLASPAQTCDGGVSPTGSLGTDPATAPTQRWRLHELHADQEQPASAQIQDCTESLRSSSNILTALLILQNLGSAMADVVVDAMIAEAVRSSGPEFAGDLQSLSWSSMAAGGILGSLLGGYALSNLAIHVIYIIFSALPLFQLISCIFIEESPEGFESKIDSSAHKHVEDQIIDSFPGKGSSDSYKYEGTRRRKGARKNSKRRSLSKQPEDHDMNNTSINLSPYLSLKSALFSLCTAFKQPTILRPMAWFFFSNIAIPNISIVMFYYQTEVLHLEASFLGTARVIGWFSLMLGTYIYNRYFKHKKLRNILILLTSQPLLLRSLPVFLSSEETVRVQCRSSSGSGVAVPTRQRHSWMRRRRGPDAAVVQIQQRQRGSK